ASASAFCIKIRLAWASFLLKSATMNAASEVDVSATTALNSESNTKSPSGTTKSEQKLNTIQLRLTFFRGKNPSRSRPMHHRQKLLHRRRHSYEGNKKRDHLGS